MASEQPYIGSVELWPLNWAPKGWEICAGQLIPIAQNTALFSLIGTTYGGNGTTNFALPDLRSRIPLGMGQGPGLSYYNLGEMGGTESVTLSQNNMPLHSHAASATVSPKASSGRSVQASPENNYNAPIPGQNAFNDAPNVTMGESPVNVTVQPAGGNQPFSNLAPFLTLNFIIATQGIYPSRP